MNKTIKQHLADNYSMPEEAIEQLFISNLEDDYGHLSEKALNNILPHMRQGLLYNEACKKARYNHSESEYQSYDKLPYYGEILKNNCLGQKKNYKSIEEQYGRISNATVHIALNQIRYLVNALIHKYGKPYAISLEYARDLPASAEERKKISKSIEEHEKANQKIKKTYKRK